MEFRQTIEQPLDIDDKDMAVIVHHDVVRGCTVVLAAVVIGTGLIAKAYWLLFMFGWGFI